MNTDLINRQRIMFTVGALEMAAFDNAVYGIPALIGHDGLRPMGWNFPFGVYFEPRLSRLIGKYQIAENSEEQALLNRAYNGALSRRYHEECEPHRAQLDYLIKGSQTAEGYYIGLGCAAYIDQNILNRVFPFLSSLLDKDGLIFLDELFKRFDYLGQGVFKSKEQDLAVFCHRYFRRSLSHINNFHFDFLDRFIKLHGLDDVRLRIALDADAIGLASSFHLRGELEFSWGPEYTDDIENIRLGVTHYRTDERQKFFSQVSAMQFWWKKNNDMRELEAEELRDDPTEGHHTDQYGCRYIHSIYDTRQRNFEHFDGAVRMYNTEEMVARIEIPMNKAGKKSSYAKLFRIDGKLDLSKWKSLITHYYQGNPLIYEYFGMKEGYETLVNETKQGEKSIMARYCPFHIKQADGPRLFVSYHVPSGVDGEFDRIIINPDYRFASDSADQAIEFCSLEIKKALNRIGENLTIPSELKFIKVQDNYINFPTILHRSHDKISGTLKAFQLLIKSMGSRNLSISFSLAWPLGDKQILVSIYGKVSEVIKWIFDNENIPAEYPDFRKWVESQRTWLAKNYESIRSSAPEMLDLLSPDGVLFIRRRPIDMDRISLTVTDKGLKASITFPESDLDLLDAFSNKKLIPALCYVVEKALCSKSGEDYFQSATSKILDPDVSADIVEAGDPWAVWTSDDEEIDR